jgi:glycosyltransferase involved in cell wall biosynthesis
MSRPRHLLFVSPIRPALTGNGLAMRAGLFLEALARDNQVTLLIIPVAGSLREPDGFAEKHAHRIITLDLDGKLDPLWNLCERVTDPEARLKAFLDYPRPALCRYATSPGVEAIRAVLADADFAAIHIMRAYLCPYIAPLLLAARSSGVHASLDLDDDEALTHERFGALLESLGRSDEARLEKAEAAKYTRLESTWLPHFERLFVCTEAHAIRISDTHPDARVTVVANHVAVPRLLLRWPRRGQHILFVGNLSYLPNVLGLIDFARDCLPRIRADIGRPVTLRIAGGAPAPEVIALAGQPGIELVANPRGLARHYRWADLAIVPVNAGGGTRIKLIEAFAQGVPVVSTTVGAEGIPALDGVHLRLADTRQAFAMACVEMLADRRLARRMARQARAFVETRYSRVLGHERIRAILQSH